jgi:succinate-semialdehyde dehydrogenase/glutarate-semialdehyde dehydrogenase
VALALMAGNGVVLKPSSVTPLTGERIRRVLERAGVPEGLVRVVHGPGTGAALVETSVAKIFFSGSVQAGRAVGEACARRLRPSALELGGKGPMIVLPDADVERAVSGALWGGFANAGQTCSGVERVYVLAPVAERFIAGVADRAQRLRVGDPMSWETEVGPLISDERFATVRALVDDAVAAGAALRCGGPAPAGAPFYSPAVLTGVTHEMRIMREQVFGPVLPVVVVDSEDDAIALANGSPFALGASVWTADRAKGERVAAELRAGTMWINDHGGAGRDPTKFGLYECVEVKLRVSEPSTVRNAWWHPYDETLGQALRQGAMILYGRPSIRARALKEGLGPLLKVSARLARDAVRR